MMRYLLLCVAPAAVLFVGCTESNPQPAPQNGADSSIEAADTSAETVAHDVALDFAGEFPPDVTGDVPSELPADVPSDHSPELAPDDLPSVPDLVPEELPCEPQCEGKECGPNGCGAACGSCDEGCVCGADGVCMGCGEELTCQQIYLCVYGCALLQDYDACPTQCLENGGPEALFTWNLWVDCLEEEGYVDCVSDYCPSGQGSPGCDQEGLDECTGQSWETCEPTLLECAYGTQTCVEVAECVAGCQSSDWICRLLCLAHGSVAAQGAFIAFEECESTGGSCDALWAVCGG